MIEGKMCSNYVLSYFHNKMSRCLWMGVFMNGFPDPIIPSFVFQHIGHLIIDLSADFCVNAPHWVVRLCGRSLPPPTGQGEENQGLCSQYISKTTKPFFFFFVKLQYVSDQIDIKHFKNFCNLTFKSVFSRLTWWEHTDELQSPYKCIIKEQV